MPKVKSCKSDQIRQWIKNYDHLATDGKTIFCQVCSKHVSKFYD